LFLWVNILQEGVDLLEREWYTLSTADLAEALDSNCSRGLTHEQVEQRRKQYGLNELEEQKGITVWEMFLGQFKEFLVILLIAAAVISLAIGETTDAIVILAVVLLNAVLGVIQEYKAEKSLAALKTLSAPTAKVVREGAVFEIPARELVPGDLVVLEAGDYIPADARLVEAASLAVDESALTGESVPVEKDAAFIAPETLPLADRKNMVHMGTMATAGRGCALVTATGMNTEIGHIAGMIQAAPVEKTPLQKKLDHFGRRLGLLAIFLCALIFILGVLRGIDILPMFLTSVSLAVASIPEGLPAIITIVLALGVQRMARQQAIIRKLPAVETLGAATVICSDKTGTLTQNEMTVRRIDYGAAPIKVTGEGYKSKGEFLSGDEVIEPLQDRLLRLLLTIGLLNNDACILEEEGQFKVVGDPTEGALITVAEKAGLVRSELAAALPRIHEYPFDSTRKLMSTVHLGDLALPWPGLKECRAWLLTKGAPDMVLERCRYRITPSGLEELTASQKEELLSRNGEMARDALRVLGFAFRPLPEEAACLPMEEAERELVFAGFMGMIDPPRPEAKEAIKTCHEAGIDVKMITGDHAETALAIARELGLASSRDEIITGLELEQIDDEELAARIDRLKVFARVAPEQKVRIVRALKANGEIAAMTGDGVNDAPALKQADIGTAMGRTGTAVAKEAAEMVLADDNFATIVHAVEEGRVIYENIKKAVFFLLSCNAGEIVTIFLAILLGWPLPLLPIQILWVNLITDTLPALALGVDPRESDMMRRPPRDPQSGLFDAHTVRTLIAFGLLIGLITLAAFSVGAGESVEVGRTMAFATLSLCQLVHVFNFRSLHHSVVGRNFYANRQLLGAVVISGALQLFVLLVPAVAGIFHVVPLDPEKWFYVAALSLTPLFMGEMWKAAHAWLSSRRKDNLRSI
jgi:Ca2+-transporting ATPase